MIPRALRAALAVVVSTLAPAMAPAAGATASEDAPLVIVGAPGLAWSDLDRDDLPALTAMAESGAVGSLTVRGVRSRSCAVDGWLTLSAGRRAGDLPGPCRDPLPVVGGQVPRWAEYLAAAAVDSVRRGTGAARGGGHGIRRVRGERRRGCGDRGRRPQRFGG